MSTEESEQHAKAEQHASEQREDQNSLLRGLLGMVKIVGGLIAMLLSTGIVVGIADHYKLISVADVVSGLSKHYEDSSKDTAIRNEVLTSWRASVTNDLLNQKAEVLALTSRLQIVESEARQVQRTKP